MEEKTEAKQRGSVPRSYYIEFTLPREEWRKLREWLDNHDRIAFATGSEEKVYLFNETALEKTEA